jgi:hypothetical protein
MKKLFSCSLFALCISTSVQRVAAQTPPVCPEPTIISVKKVPCTTGSGEKFEIKYTNNTGFIGSIKVSSGSGGNNHFTECVNLPPCANLPCSTLVVYTTGCMSTQYSLDTIFRQTFPGPNCTNTCITVPVKFNSFDAKDNGGKVSLTWVFEDEESMNGPNARFEIERSYDGKAFSQIGIFLPINGKTGLFIDASPDKKNVYYRIVAIENNGHKNYSRIAFVSLEKSEEIKAFLNGIKLFFKNPPQGPTMVKIYDAVGKLYSANMTSTLSTGVDMPSLGKGLYIVSLVSKDTGKTYSGKFIVN